MYGLIDFPSFAVISRHVDVRAPHLHCAMPAICANKRQAQNKKRKSPAVTPITGVLSILAALNLMFS